MDVLFTFHSRYLHFLVRNYIFFTFYLVVSKNHCIFATSIWISIRVEEWADILEEALACCSCF